MIRRSLFRGDSIQRKLTMVMTLASGAVLLLSSATLIGFSLFRQREILLQHLGSDAGLLARNSTAALTFGDRRAAEELLSSLQAKYILGARLYGQDGAVFASYIRGHLARQRFPDRAWPPGTYQQADSLLLFRPVQLDGETVGTLALSFDSRLVARETMFYVLVALGLFPVFLVCAWMLAARLQGLISKPILELAAIASSVSRDKNYSVRVFSRNQDEVGVLIEAFNEMLSQIESQTQEQARMNEDLRRAKEKAEEVARLKSEFLANMSHEIRTPMNGVLGMTALALETHLTDDQREYLTAARNSAESLMTVINDILDFSKIEAGKMTLNPVEVDLEEALRLIVRSHALKAHQKGLELMYEIQPEAPGRVTADLGRLRQVLVNLLGNAIKFTEAGEVVVRVGLEWIQDRECSLRFEVCDTGIGIPKDKQDLIFDAFSQADGSMTRRYGGTGLGLAISRQLVELMGGKLWLESEEGTGSRFHFTIRAGVLAGRAREESEVGAEALGGLHVLVVDDNATNRRILEALIESWGARVEPAESGPAAITLLRDAAARGQPFGLAVLDAQMPGMDGFSLARRIQEENLIGHGSVMMLSSADLHTDIARCRRLGISVYLVKPISRDELLAALLACLTRTQGAPQRRSRPASLPGPAAPPSGRRILLAEDNQVNQRLVERLLARRGHAVALASNGLQALRLLESDTFDLILMDVQMPEMGGFEATARIRQRERDTGGRVPIVALTARAMSGDREECLEHGMDAYLSKPIDPQQLYRLLDELLTGTAVAEPEPRSI